MSAQTLTTPNETQQAAILSDARRIACMAAAGSGKTRVLTGRVVDLIQNRGVSPEDILVVTFTRKAAREMKGRITKELGNCDGMMIDTFHAIALKMVSETVGRPVTMISPDDADALFERTVTEQGLTRKMGPCKRIRQNRNQTGMRPVDRAARIAIKEYERRLQQMYAADYGSILLWLEAILHTNANLRWFKHILIDEAQDCDPLQWRIIELFDQNHATQSTFIVGDPNQSIYGWRGAKVDGMFDFAERADEVFKMTTTYRCKNQIADAATRMIYSNERGGEFAITHASGTGRVTRERGPLANICAEAGYSVPCSYPTPIETESTAYLCRTNADADKVADLLVTAGHSVHRAGHVARKSHEKQYRRAWAMLSLAWNPRNDIAFEVLLSTGAIALTEKIVTGVRTTALNLGKSMWDVYAGLAKASRVTHWVGKRLQEMTAQQAWIVLDLPADEFYDLPLHCSVSSSLQLLESMQFMDSEDVSVPDGHVYVGTIHGAKGLEFDRVYVVGCDRGFFPQNESDCEDARRVMYVAMTRARSELILHYRENPSIFIEEATS